MQRTEMISLAAMSPLQHMRQASRIVVFVPDRNQMATKPQAATGSHRQPKRRAKDSIFPAPHCPYPDSSRGAACLSYPSEGGTTPVRRRLRYYSEPRIS
jgi:hypothetical protein